MCESVRDERILQYFRQNGIKWKFIADCAPWWGGFWERLIRTVKTALQQAWKTALLNYVELETVLTEV